MSYLLLKKNTRRNLNKNILRLVVGVRSTALEAMKQVCNQFNDLTLQGHV